jgi:hypothetical protein
MDSAKFVLKNVYDAVNEQMIAIKGNQFKPNHMLLKDRLGKEYLVSEINIQDCIKKEHIIFCSYFPNSDITNDEMISFGVAMPMELYAGIELFSVLPKHLDQKYKNKGTEIGFGKPS